MSFSSAVKTELLAVKTGPCCERAFFSAVLLFGREFSAAGLSLLTENETVAQAYADAVRYFSGTAPRVIHTDAGNYKILTEDRELAESVLAEMGYSYPNTARRIRFEAIPDRCCRESFLRGAFVVSGTVTDPEKEYHLEFSCPARALSEDLTRLLEAFGVPAKSTDRGGSRIVYIKNSGEIEDLLSLMGATENAMELMGAKMFKDVRNTINRKVNFENANIARSMAAAVRQYEAIMKIARTKGLDSLPADLKLLAEARIENRELGAAELAKLLPGNLTVSGINHRFKRIREAADAIGEPDGSGASQ